VFYYPTLDTDKAIKPSDPDENPVYVDIFLNLSQSEEIDKVAKSESEDASKDDRSAALFGAPRLLDSILIVVGGSVRKYSTAGQYRERWRESTRRE